MDCLLVCLRNYGLEGPAHHLKTNDALSLRFEDIKSASKVQENYLGLRYIPSTCVANATYNFKPSESNEFLFRSAYTTIGLRPCL